jgi:hypothetical protein
MRFAGAGSDNERRASRQGVRASSDHHSSQGPAARSRQPEPKRRCKAFERMSLDFGIYDIATERNPWPSYLLPGELVRLAGRQGIEIELSFYGAEPPDG